MGMRIKITLLSVSKDFKEERKRPLFLSRVRKEGKSVSATSKENPCSLSFGPLGDPPAEKSRQLLKNSSKERGIR
jgi:hypothetical protein